MSLLADKKSMKMKIRDLENAFRYRRIPYPKRSVELIALIAISCTFFLFMHTKNLNTRLREMEVKLQPSEFSALGLTGEHHLSGGDSAHSNDINTLHGTYQYLKSTGQLSSLSSDKLNNTKYAALNVIIFNRVVKAGSQSMMKLMKLLGRFNDYQVTFQGGANHLKLLTPPAELTKAKSISNLPEETVYTEHVNYINFTKLGLPQPIYINLVRDPVERVISWFFYIRGSYKNAIYFRQHLQAEFQGEKWFKKDFGTCVRTGDPECNFKQHSMKQLDFRSQALFFCGNELNCLPFNSASAVQVAKRNVEKHYAVVGSWEDTNVTLTVLEKFIPRYFSGAKLLFEIHKEVITNEYKNQRKPKIDDDVKDILRKNFTEEYDFYYFCKQRLYKQYISVKLNDVLSK